MQPQDHGGDATHFVSNETVTRAEPTLFLYAAKGRPGYRTEQSPFKDVKKKHWYHDSAIWANENGLERGENGKFNAPPCTRACAVSYLYRFFSGNDLIA